MRRFTACNPSRGAWFVLAAASALLACRAAIGEEARPVRDGEHVTFNRDVAQILFKHCAACHRPSEVAPFALLTYRDASKRARLIQSVTSRRYMPPWKPAPGHGDFVDAHRLTDHEIETISRWVAGGAAEGSAADLPMAPSFTPGWRLGEPDMVITLPEAYEIPVEGPDIYRNFVIPLAIPEGKYLKAAEFRASNPKVVHHAALGYDVSGKARESDAADEGPGFTQFGLPGQLFPGSTGIWTPGHDPIALPEGFSMAWPARADLIVQLHLHPSGKPEVEQSTIGLYLTDEPPKQSMIDLVLINREIDIPPGESRYVLRDSIELPVDMDASGIFPHMHLLGRKVDVTAELPDGSRKPLLLIDDWDFNWQNHYQYSTRVRLPAGTKLMMECVHDNSAENPNNPSDPPRRVTWGEATTDEMALVLVQLVPADEADVPELRKKLKDRIIGGVVVPRKAAPKTARSDRTAEPTAP